MSRDLLGFQAYTFFGLGLPSLYKSKHVQYCLARCCYYLASGCYPNLKYLTWSWSKLRVTMLGEPLLLPILTSTDCMIRLANLNIAELFTLKVHVVIFGEVPIWIPTGCRVGFSMSETSVPNLRVKKNSESLFIPPVIMKKRGPRTVV